MTTQVIIKLKLGNFLFFCTPFLVWTAFDHFTQLGAFPTWVKAREQKLLETNNVQNADVVVALDGTGNFTKVTDTMLSAPNHSDKRFVIHVNRGNYVENVIIAAEKMNLKIGGDGMDVTSISGNLSHDQKSFDHVPHNYLW
jgi:pectinesterase